MTEHIKDGGPAFPVGDVAWYEPRTVAEEKRAAAGMSIIDYWATEAMNASIIKDGMPASLNEADLVAQNSYEMAEAMLRTKKAREAA